MSDEPGGRAPDMPPSPMAQPVAERAPDPPLPWSTPVATVLAVLAVSPVVMLLLWLTAQDRKAWWEVPLLFVWYGLTVGLGATIMDRLKPGWSAPRRWALGMAVLSVVPSPAFLVIMAVEAKVEPSALIAFVELAAVGCGLLGWALGSARRRSQALWWRLPVNGALVAGGLPLALMGAAVALQVAIQRGSSSPAFLLYILPGALAVAAVLALFGGAIGLALAERTHRALRASGAEQGRQA